jgi:hypothetical protein
MEKVAFWTIQSMVLATGMGKPSTDASEISRVLFATRFHVIVNCYLDAQRNLNLKWVLPNLKFFLNFWLETMTY